MRAAERLLRFSGAVVRAPDIESWFDAHPTELGSLARVWFERMRRLGPDVREILHDDLPTACVEDAPFAYVGVFKAHVNVGFFHGAALPDPAQLLRGTGKRMRHVKVVPGVPLDERALDALVTAACDDLRTRLRSAN